MTHLICSPRSKNQNVRRTGGLHARHDIIAYYQIYREDCTLVMIGFDIVSSDYTLSALTVALCPRIETTTWRRTIFTRHGAWNGPISHRYTAETCTARKLLPRCTVAMNVTLTVRAAYRATTDTGNVWHLARIWVLPRVYTQCRDEADCRKPEHCSSEHLPCKLVWFNAIRPPTLEGLESR